MSEVTQDPACARTRISSTQVLWDWAHGPGVLYQLVLAIQGARALHCLHPKYFLGGIFEIPTHTFFVHLLRIHRLQRGSRKATCLMVKVRTLYQIISSFSAQAGIRSCHLYGVSSGKIRGREDSEGTHAVA